VVHGLASERRLAFGDIVSLDVGVVYQGFIGDTARTVAVGGCSVEAQRLMDVTEQALYLGIAQAHPESRWRTSPGHPAPCGKQWLQRSCASLLAMASGGRCTRIAGAELDDGGPSELLVPV